MAAWILEGVILTVGFTPNLLFVNYLIEALFLFLFCLSYKKKYECYKVEPNLKITGYFWVELSVHGLIYNRRGRAVRVERPDRNKRFGLELQTWIFLYQYYYSFFTYRLYVRRLLFIRKGGGNQILQKDKKRKSRTENGQR